MLDDISEVGEVVIQRSLRNFRLVKKHVNSESLRAELINQIDCGLNKQFFSGMRLRHVSI